MAVGIFGKLPAKRDYVMHGMPPELMDVLDPWLQSAVAQSRNDMGNNWLSTYLASPIWRFWLGSRISGQTVIGALMPSVDGVGRYFPLCCAGFFDKPPAPPIWTRMTTGSKSWKNTCSRPFRTMAPMTSWWPV